MNESKRFFGIGVMVASLLGPVISAGCGPAATPDSGARAPDSGSEIFELVPVTDGVYATVVREGVSPSQYAASLIVLRTDHVLVVDSREDAASASDFSDFEAHVTRRLTASTAAERADRFAEWITETLTRAYAEAAGELDPGS